MTWAPVGMDTHLPLRELLQVVIRIVDEWRPHHVPGIKGGIGVRARVKVMVGGLELGLGTVQHSDHMMYIPKVMKQTISAHTSCSVPPRSGNMAGMPTKSTLRSISKSSNQ